MIARTPAPRRIDTGPTGPTAPTALAVLAALVLAGTGCSVLSDKENDGGANDSGKGGGEVVLVTHDSFALPKRLIEQFEKDTGYTLVHTPAGDGGKLTNELVLTKSEPLGDVAFGVDNTFASRAVEEGVFASYRPDLPAGAEDDVLAGDGADVLTPVDTGNVCVNVDTSWFEAEKLAPPKTLDDLTDPAYRGLFVTPGATSSTPGMAFLLATIAEYGDDWPDYWEDLMANDAKVVSGWEDAYNVDYTFSGGDRPIVLSYDSSPAFTLSKDGDSTSTAALESTCFHQVEYAGVLAGADNPDGAEAVVDWLLSSDVQAALPDSMYVYPVDDAAKLPADWARFAPPLSSDLTVDPAEISEHRRDWQEQWRDIVSE